MHFNPNFNGTFTIAATGASQNSPLPNGNGLLMRVQNAGPGIAYVEFGTDANMPALDIKLTPGDTRMAVVSASTSSVSFTRGDMI